MANKGLRTGTQSFTGITVGLNTGFIIAVLACIAQFVTTGTVAPLPVLG